MNPTEFEAKLRAGEAWHGERVPAERWAVVRVDGRGFSGFTQAHFQKPFDPRFYELMAQTARALMEQWDGLRAFFESDEISLLLPRNFTHFNRGHEKLVSLCGRVRLGALHAPERASGAFRRARLGRRIARRGRRLLPLESERRRSLRA